MARAQKNDRSRGNRNQAKRMNGKSRRDFEGKDKSKFKESDLEGKTSGSNSPDWYGSTSHLMTNAAQLSMHGAIGRPLTIKVKPYDDQYADDSVVDFVPPGIMAFDVIHHCGVARDWNAPVNVAARHIYTFVRHVNSGHSNYDAANLMMYLTLMDNAYTYYAWMVRLYGVMRTVMLRNRYMPVGIIEASGVEYIDLAENLADFRYYINTYANKINQLAVPDVMPIFKRHMWMYSNVYADAPSDKAQFYLFRPKGFWMYEITASDHYCKLNSTPNTFADICMRGNLIIQNILNNEDYNIMSGDIMKAYGDKLFRLPPIAEEYQVVPVYDPEILMQIHNATILNEYIHPESDTEWRIKEDRSETNKAGALILNPYIKYRPENTAAFCDQVIDFPVDSVTPTNIAIATRLMCSAAKPEQVDTGSEVYYRAPLITSGTETIVGTAILETEDGHVFNELTGDYNNSPLYSSVEVFEQRPLRYASVFHENTHNMRVSDIKGDLNNYTIIDESSLMNIHEAAQLALYGLL